MNLRRLAPVLALCGAVCFVGASAAWADSWPQSGNDSNNSRNQAGETAIGPGNVDGLAVAWAITTAGDVTSTPAVEDGYVYFGDWGGFVYKVDAVTGAPEWIVPLNERTGIAPMPDWTRHTPSVAGNLVITGNQSGRFGQGGAKLVALDKGTGELVWATQLDPNISSIVTSSPTIHDGTIYVGVASYEEAFAAVVDNYPCCFFRGSVVALDLATGAIKWQAYMAPPGFSGNAVWGSSPAVDAARNQVYVATGNNYSAPDSYHDCIASAKNEAQQKGCNPGDNYFDSVVALKLDSGEVNWAKRVLPYDTWNVACAPYLLPPDLLGENYEQNCDYDAGPDFDFGQGPILYTAEGPGMGRGADLVGVGQKSGVYWALRPANGDVVWSSRTGPGGLAGGHQWGSASDGARVYTSNANSGFQPWTLPDGSVTYSGIFSALDARDGSVLWQIANPAGEPGGSPASVANGVMYVCSVGGFGQPNLGQMYAIDAATGAVLWSFNSGSSCGGGASIVDGTVFWGTGYVSLGGTPGFTLFAFRLPE